MIYRLEDLIRIASQTAALINGTYVPARPMAGPWSWRAKAAWEVFRGRADAVRWPANQ